MIPIRDSVPSHSVPVVTHALILINVLVFFFKLTLPHGSIEQFFYLFGFVPARFTHPDWAANVGFPVDNYWPTWTHDYPITFERARELGLHVRSDMPENMLRLMQLYPQPLRRQPSVEYTPIPYRTGRRNPDGGNSN